MPLNGRSRLDFSRCFSITYNSYFPRLLLPNSVQDYYSACENYRLRPGSPLGSDFLLAVTFRPSRGGAVWKWLPFDTVPWASETANTKAARAPDSASPKTEKRPR